MAVPGPLHTFSVGFADPSWDESPLARDTARRSGAQHHVVTCQPETVGRLIPRLLWHYDEPISHPNSAPLAVLSQFARQWVTVVLTGEGPDEYMSGYPRHHIARARDVAAWAPSWALNLVGRVLGMLPSHRSQLAGELLPLDLADSLVFNSRFVTPGVVAELTGASLAPALAERRRLAGQAIIPGDVVASINRYELATYLQSALDRMDRMSMAFGLEARVPFLDVRLVEWGLRLPSRLKTGGATNKRVLKVLGERYLSRRITRGRKSGFGLPLDAWFRGKELGMLLEPLRQPDHPAAQHFERRVVARLLDDHRLRRANHGELLWLLANVYQWYDVHVTNGGSMPAAA
jgi:asparagine synthase (glutamine-hydrolysing)